MDDLLNTYGPGLLSDNVLGQPFLPLGGREAAADTRLFHTLRTRQYLGFLCSHGGGGGGGGASDVEVHRWRNVDPQGPISLDDIRSMRCDDQTRCLP